MCLFVFFPSICLRLYVSIYLSARLFDYPYVYRNVCLYAKLGFIALSFMTCNISKHITYIILCYHLDIYRTKH